MRDRDERGSVSAVGLCVLTAVLLLGLAAAQFTQSGANIAAEYEREMQLRLAAESGVETAAARLEENSHALGELPVEGRPKDVTKYLNAEHIPISDKTKLYVFLELPKDENAKDSLDIVGVAVDPDDEEETTRISDGEDWLRGKIVRARMQKTEKEERYVWRRWY